jgi:chaperonin GroEL
MLTTKERMTVERDAVSRVVDGAMICADVVGSTMGPCGKYVMVERKMANPMFTKDGVTASSRIHLDSALEDCGVQAVKAASYRQSVDPGDGTTATSVMAGKACELLAEAMASHPSDPVIRGAKAAVDGICKMIGDSSWPLDAETAIQVATISANSAELGRRRSRRSAGISRRRSACPRPWWTEWR